MRLLGAWWYLAFYNSLLWTDIVLLISCPPTLLQHPSFSQGLLTVSQCSDFWTLFPLYIYLLSHIKSVGSFQVNVDFSILRTVLKEHLRDFVFWIIILLGKEKFIQAPLCFNLLFVNNSDSHGCLGMLPAIITQALFFSALITLFKIGADQCVQGSMCGFLLCVLLTVYSPQSHVAFPKFFNCSTFTTSNGCFQFKRL